MENGTILADVRRVAETVAAEMGVELVHVETAGAKRNLTVRIFIDKPGGVTVDDCADFSRKAEVLLDSGNMIPSAYLLEISSPGLERELYGPEDFQRFVGQKVKVKLKAGVDGQKIFIGRIAGVEDGNVLIEDKAKDIARIPHKDIAKANLRVDLEQEFKKH